jgi:hypothetical protein
VADRVKHVVRVLRVVPDIYVPIAFVQPVAGRVKRVVRVLRVIPVTSVTIMSALYAVG